MSEVASLSRFSEVRQSARTIKVRSMYDVPPGVGSHVEIPYGPLRDRLLDDEPWEVGLIVGPSGSGKSSVAKHLWTPERVREAESYGAGLPPGDALLDAFPKDMGIAEVTGLLTSVGLGSTPTWLRPFGVLSTGERFRAGVALAIASADGDRGRPLVLDEWTSTVDRRVAQIGSAAVQKTVRRRGVPFVAVTCHDDVAEWLEPDWIYRPDLGTLARERLQRPSIDLELRPVGRDLWPVFAPHHYLSGELHVAAKCIGAFDVATGEPVGFVAYYRFPHPTAKDIMVNHRTVVLPDWQGVGIGVRLVAEVGELLAQDGDRFRTTCVHPGLVHAFRKHPRFREDVGGNKPSNSRKPKRLVAQHADPRKLLTKTFEYKPVGRRRRPVR